MSVLSATPFLWFQDQAEAAIARYCRLLPDTRVLSEQRLPDGSLFLAEIEVVGQRLTLMNGGDAHRLTDAFSIALSVETQEDIDTITAGLIDGGGHETACGWLVDAFGMSWQVVPTALHELLGDPDPVKSGRVREAMLGMRRLSIQGLRDAYDGTVAD